MERLRGAADATAADVLDPLQRTPIERLDAVDAGGIAGHAQQALREADDGVDALLAAGEHDVSIADGKLRHPGDAHAGVADLPAEEIEHFHEAGRAEERIDHVERDPGHDDGVGARLHHERPDVGHLADEDDVGALDEIVESDRKDCCGGRRRRQNEPENHAADADAHGVVPSLPSLAPAAVLGFATPHERAG